MLAVCNADPHLASLSADHTYVPRPDFRASTRFERRGERLGHGVWDLAYTKLETASAVPSEKAAANPADDK
jgi:tRNA (guanine-N7-)-methyltransferase